MEIGNDVLFVDNRGVEHTALVTFVHGKSAMPSINVVYVMDDESLVDQYGRQIMRATSVPHADNQSARGYFWREV